MTHQLNSERLAEIEARLRATDGPHASNIEGYDAQLQLEVFAKRDIAYLLSEVKRLSGWDNKGD